MQTSVTTSQDFPASQSVRRNRVALSGALTLSIAVALFAVFGLADWAEVSAAHHAVQHIILFLGGVGVGSSMIASIKTTLKRGK